jgi:uncharacterized protein YggE
VRTAAVHDAVTRAQQYADALGLSGVRPVAVADAGMLGVELHLDGRPAATFLRAAGSAGTGPDVELAPEEIEVSAAVDARFAVSDA